MLSFYLHKFLFVKGAIVGGFLSLVIPMWISIGSYLVVPGSPTLPTNTSGCVWDEIAAVNSTVAAPLEANMSESMYVEIHFIQSTSVNFGASIPHN